MKPETIRILSRDSFLALAQTFKVSDYLMSLGHRVEINALKTAGDIKLDAPLYQISQFSAAENKTEINKEGKAYFTKELEDGLLNGIGDIAVHSLKDLPTALPDGLSFSTPIMPVESSDSIITTKPLPENYNEQISVLNSFVIGSSSLRRIALLNKWLPNANILSVRGNLVTRLEKLLNNKEPDALILATAGVKRLFDFFKYWKEKRDSWQNKIDITITERLDKDFNRLKVIFDQELYYYEINPEAFKPAVSQGVLGIESSENQSEKFKSVFFNSNYSDKLIRRIKLERSLLSELEAGCHIPYGNLVELKSYQNTDYYSISAFFARNYKPEDKSNMEAFESTRLLPAEFTDDQCRTLVNEIKGQKFPVVLCGLENNEFIKTLKERNFETWFIPLIQASAVKNETTVEAEYSYGIVSSKNCVDFLPESLPKIDKWITVGQKTSEYLKEKLKIQKVLVPEINDGLNAAKLALSESENNENFIWFGALNGRKEGIDLLKSNGRNITVFNGYETKELKFKAPANMGTDEFLNRKSFWVFTSPSSAKSYFDQNLYRQDHLICTIGQSTAAVFFNKSIVPYYIASKSDLEIMAKEIAGDAINLKFTLKEWRLA